MYTINLGEELVKSKASLLSKEEKLHLSEANKIVSGINEQEAKILNQLGLDHSINTAKQIERKVRTISSFDKTRVFSKDEIKELCIRYGLRFLPINKYKGEVDPSVPGKVLEFEKEFERVKKENRDFDKHYSYSNYYICAPAQSFQLSERPKDPLMFYPIGHDSFYLVHKWGSDISAWRLLSSFPLRGFWPWMLSRFVVLFPFVMAFLFLVNPVFFAKGFIMTFLAVSFMDVVAVFFVAAICGMFEGFDNYFSYQTWNSEYKD